MANPGVKLSELWDHKDKFVTVKHVDPSGNSEPRETAGKVIATSSTALVLHGRNDIILIEIEYILSIEEVIKFTIKDSLVIRELARVTVESVRQHLLDRHGAPIDFVRDIKDEAAIAAHDSVDHRLFGHVHGQKERGRPGRKPRKADPSAVQLQGEDQLNGNPTHVCDE